MSAGEAFPDAYFPAHKPVSMDLDTAVTIGYDHFCRKHGFDTFSRELIFSQYAKEELKISADAQRNYLEGMLHGPGQKYTQDFTRFCMWYYINFVIDHTTEDC
jgi:hypothetical protein